MRYYNFFFQPKCTGLHVYISWLNIHYLNVFHWSEQFTTFHSDLVERGNHSWSTSLLLFRCTATHIITSGACRLVVIYSPTFLEHLHHPSDRNSSLDVKYQYRRDFGPLGARGRKVCCGRVFGPVPWTPQYHSVHAAQELAHRLSATTLRLSAAHKVVAALKQERACSDAGSPLQNRMSEQRQWKCVCYKQWRSCLQCSPCPSRLALCKDPCFKDNHLCGAPWRLTCRPAYELLYVADLLLVFFILYSFLSSCKITSYPLSKNSFESLLRKPFISVSINWK